MSTPLTCEDCNIWVNVTQYSDPQALLCPACIHDRKEHKASPATSSHSCTTCKLYWRDCARYKGCPGAPKPAGCSLCDVTTPVKASSAAAALECPGAPKPAERLSTNETTRCISPIPMHPLSEMQPPPAARDALHQKRKIASLDSSDEEEEDTLAKRQKAHGVAHLHGDCPLCKLLPYPLHCSMYKTCIHRSFESCVSFDFQAYVYRSTYDKSCFDRAAVAKCQMNRILDRPLEQVAADERKVRWHRYLADTAARTNQVPCLLHTECSCSTDKSPELSWLHWDYQNCPSPPADFE